MLIRILRFRWTLIATCMAWAGVSWAQAPGSTTYRVDSSQSYVKAYVSHWVESPGSQDNSAGTSPLTKQWTPRWDLATFALSGTLDVEYTTGSGDRYVTFSNVRLVTDAPAYSGFSIPGSAAFPTTESANTYIIPNPPGTYCFCVVQQFVPPQSDATGFLEAGHLSMSGPTGFFLGPSYAYVPVTGPEPPSYVPDPAPVQGYYSYSLQAAAVPEPESWAQLSVGLVSVVLVFGLRKRHVPA